MQRLLDPSVDVVLTEPAFSWEDLPPHSATLPRNRAENEAVLEFGRFIVLLRQRQLLADSVPIKLGTRAFDVLLTLLEADGALVTKEELFSRVWPGIVVAEENLKTQISVLRKALGEDRDFVHTEIGRGYRFTGTIQRTVASIAPRRSSGWRHCSAHRPASQWGSRRTPHAESSRGYCRRRLAQVV